MVRSARFLGITVTVAVCVALTTVPAFSQPPSTDTLEDQEIIENLELLSMLDIMQEDHEMLINYEDVASADVNVLNVQEEGDDNE